MKLAIIGPGKMGRAVERCANEKGHEIVTRIGRDDWEECALEQADICIEFTTPGAAFENIRKLAERKKSIVVGTTGWLERLPEVEELVKRHGIGLFYAQNFSIGMAKFMKLVKEAALLLPEYDAAIIETHHNQKLDAPSGSAQAIAGQFQSPPPVSSVRVGNVPGIHEVVFDGLIDSITLTHTARNRDGFANGAVAAAEWLKGKNGIFTMEAML